MSKVATTLEALRDQPDEELKQALARTRDELFRLHLGQHTNQVTSTAQLRSKRRDIARILTILNGRKQGLEVQAQKKAETPGAEAAQGEEKPAKKSKAKKAKS
jgi:large subunit ribosomal protein L29